MQIPEIFLNSICDCDGFDKNKFIEAHQQKPPVALRLNTEKMDDFFLKNYNYLKIENKIPWAEYGFYLKERPSFTFDPLFQAGCYYVQEPSSMFLEQALKQKIDLSKQLTVLDLSAAPGGKTTHLLSLLNENSLVVSNEVIQSRAEILKHNLIKWGKPNVVLTNNDPKDFSSFDSFFDVLLLDVPCSGSGLFRKDERAIKTWDVENVKHCALRQKRIIADIIHTLKENGLLIYSTCSFSKEENEDNVKWMMENFDLQLEKINLQDDWGVLETEYGYRFWNYNLEGEGFFISVFKKKSFSQTKEINYLQKKQIKHCNENISEKLEKYFSKSELSFSIFKNNYYAFPSHLQPQLDFIAENLNVKYFGIETAEQKGNDYIPLHPLALYPFISRDFIKNNLSYEDAIRFLKKQNIEQSLNSEKGWQLVSYLNFPLGWVKQIGSRVNNYYPNHYRILKDIPVEE